MYGLADLITQRNSTIFCNSTAFDFEQENNMYITNVNNYKIKSKYLVISSHYPFKKIKRTLFCENVSINILCTSNRY